MSRGGGGGEGVLPSILGHGDVPRIWASFSAEIPEPG